MYMRAKKVGRKYGRFTVFTCKSVETYIPTGVTLIIPCLGHCHGISQGMFILFQAFHSVCLRCMGQDDFTGNLVVFSI